MRSAHVRNLIGIIYFDLYTFIYKYFIEIIDFIPLETEAMGRYMSLFKYVKIIISCRF